MSDIDERNEDYIGDKIDKEGIMDFLRCHPVITQVGLTLFILFILTEIYGTVYTFKNFFGTESVTRNPVKIFIDCVITHPVVALIFLALSFIAGRLITGWLIAERVPRLEENARGEIIDNTGIHGRGNIADLDEIQKVFVFTDDDHTTGTILGEHPFNGKVICKEFVVPGQIKDHVHSLRNDHIFLCGMSSSGKTTNSIPQNIINHMLAGHSLATTDPSGELYRLIAPVARYLGYKVRCLNLRPDEMQASDGCDILWPLRNSTNPESMADTMCAAILRNATGGKTDEFWEKGNINLLSLVLLYVSHAKGFVPITTAERRDEKGNILEPLPSQRVFREVAAYIEDPYSMESYIEAAIVKDPNGDGRLLGGRFRTWKRNEKKDQIASGLSTSLSIFRNRWVAEILSHDDMSVEQLVNEKCIYFVITHPLGEAFRTVTSLYFTTLFDELFRIAFKQKGGVLPRMVYIFLEELQTMGLLTTLPATLDNIRKHNVGLMLCTQEIAMLEDIYGTGTTISMLNNCLVQMCMGTNTDYTGGGILTNAKFFSMMSGIQTVNEKYVTENRHKFVPERIQEYTVMEQSQRAQNFGAEVYMTDDVYRIKGDEVLIRPAMHNPFMAKRFFWKRHPLSDIAVQNKVTGELHELMAFDHTPHYESGTDDLFDTEIYELVDLRSGEKKHRAEKGSGVRYDKFM